MVLLLVEGEKKVYVGVDFRVSLIGLSSLTVQQAVTIAVRYSAVRVHNKNVCFTVFFVVYFVPGTNSGLSKSNASINANIG